jgi:hypothetical protein
MEQWDLARSIILRILGVPWWFIGQKCIDFWSNVTFTLYVVQYFKQYLLVVVIFDEGDYLLAVMAFVVKHFFGAKQQRFILKSAIVNVFSSQFYVLLGVLIFNKFKSLVNLFIRGNIARIWLFD